MVQFVIDNFAYILVALGIYAGGCYTPSAWLSAKAAVAAWIAKKVG